MLKNFFLASIMMLTIFSFSSCKDHDSSTTPQDEQDGQNELADYTVIFWGSAGENEAWTISDLSNLMLLREEGKINSKVNMVGCLDPTMKYSQALAANGLGGTIEFELGTKRNTGADTLSLFKEVAGYENGVNLDAEEAEVRKDDDFLYPKYLELYSKVFASMKSCKANSKYDIYNSLALENFIAKAAKEHPAKNYVLMLYGHGTGYIPGVEGPKSQASRFCITSTDGENQFLSLDDVSNAVTGSGVKIKTVFYQCCQMAALENFAGMKNATDYVVASAEPTEGGYYPYFISYLSEVGASDEGLKTACKKAVDYYANCVISNADEDITSHGFYDLTKTDELLKPVKKAATWFASAAKTNTQFMNDVVLNSEVVFSTKIDPALSHEMANELQKDFNNALRGGKLILPSGYDVGSLFVNIAQANSSKLCGVCFANIMETALSDEFAAEAKGLDLEALKKIYTEYMSALKDMAYIRCNGTEANDAAYKYASPSVNLFSMSKLGYQYNIGQYGATEEGVKEVITTINECLYAGENEDAFNVFVYMIGGTINASYTPSLDNIKAIYKATEFDKVTGWSKVLENVYANPLLLVNPTRYDIINK